MRFPNRPPLSIPQPRRARWGAASLAASAIILGALGSAPAMAQPAPAPAVQAAIQDFRQGRAVEAERALRPLAATDNDAAAWLAVVLLSRSDSSGLGEAIALLRRAAAAGNAEAQHNLALQHAIGRGVPQDDARAFELFSRAAGQGHARAMVNLGTFCMEGRGTARDPARARAWYEKAAASGDPYGAFALGRLFESERNVSRAAELYRQAADKGHVGAALRYGRMLAAGNGVSRDAREAQVRLRHAVDAGSPEAALALADVMAQLAGRGELPRNVETAKQIAELYRRAAEAGLASAQFKLGNAHFAGTGVARDFEAAERWYRRAAQQNNAEAQYTLGIWLSGGVGGKQEPVEGYGWLLLAERNGYADAALVKTRAAEKLTAAQIAQADAWSQRFRSRTERQIGDVDSLPLRPPRS